MADIISLPSNANQFRPMNQDQFRHLPDAPHPKTSDRYMFIDTKRVIQDMRDLGFEVYDFLRPKTRTPNGVFGLHQVDFRRPEDMNMNGHEAPRILFSNSYDGSKRAQFLSGLIRFACTNGLVVGDFVEQHKFLRLGNYEEELVAQIKVAGENATKLFDRLETLRSIRLEEPEYLDMADQALKLRYPADDKARLDIDPAMILMPRRQEDTAPDLFTQFNVLQENLIKGGVPGRNSKDEVRLSQPVRHIGRSNDLNAGLWNLMDQFAELA